MHENPVEMSRRQSPTARCVIADDEPLAIRLLQNYVERIDGLELAGSYPSATDALQRISAGDIDLAFLDIRMPGMDGLELARQTRAYGTKVVFVTAHRDYAFDGFRVAAIDYLLKPVSFPLFKEAVDRFFELVHGPVKEAPAAKIISVKSDYRTVPVRLDEIIFVEGLKDYVKIHTEDRLRPIITQASLKAMESQLPEQNFVRVHRSYIVAINKVKSFGRNSINMGTTDIPIGDTYRSRVLALLS